MLSQITSCKNCCFAQYEDITQTGCSLNRLNAFINNGTNPIEAYDEEEEFYIIPNRQCMFKRSKNWLKNKTEEKVNLFDAAFAEIPFPYHVVIMGKNNTRDILKSAQSTLDQEFFPARISVIRPYETTSDIHTIRTYLEDARFVYHITWKLENIVNPDMKWNTLMHQLVMTQNKLPYVLFMDAGAILPNKTIEILRKKIYIDLLQFTAIVDETFARTIILMPFNIWTYYRLTTNPTLPLIDNIKQINKSEGNDPCKNIYKLDYMINQKLLSYMPVEN